MDEEMVDDDDEGEGISDEDMETPASATIQQSDVFEDPSIQHIEKDEFEAIDPAELVRKQQLQVVELGETLGVPVSVAGALLRAYRWNKEKLFQDFFDNKNKVCKKAGVSLDDYGYITGESGKEGFCPICYDDVDCGMMYALKVCKHFACKNCWKEYMEVAIGDGPTCLSMTCPQRNCNIIVDETLVSALVNDKAKSKYGEYLARSFVDDNPKIKWCPAPDCGKAVYCPDVTQSDVKCVCGYKFCFKCHHEAHLPSPCDLVKAWLKKAADESETANWISANTKDCPKCKRAIEKNGGCNHMTCSQCRYEFCWICMDDWSLHSGSTGGYYKCNRYKEEELEVKLKMTEKEQARAAIEKYMHYFKRYANHELSQKFENKLRTTAEQKMRDLQIKNKYSSWIDVEHIKNAVEQLIDCRRTLKWTYVFAYYMDDGPEKNLFEYLQEDLERNTEKLSEILEGPIEKFDRDEILNQTKAAKT